MPLLLCLRACCPLPSPFVATTEHATLPCPTLRPPVPHGAQLNPLASHIHAMEGFALGWSPVKAGRLASGDCKRHIHVWEPTDGGGWAVSAPYQGHGDSVEDIAWSPTEETVFATCGVDKTVRIWDTRERGRSMLHVSAHDCDVNVIGWNGLVTYMLASGGDDGSLRIWDLRAFKDGGFVSHFAFHKCGGAGRPGTPQGALSVCCYACRTRRSTAAHSGPLAPTPPSLLGRSAITSVEWSPDEGSMLATTGADNAVAVWDLALERDPEEEQALAPEGNAMLQVGSRGGAGLQQHAQGARAGDMQLSLGRPLASGGAEPVASVPASPHLQEELPAQLLFVHAGQTDVKELHWHHQIPGMIGTTASDGFNLFRPSNL